MYMDRATVVIIFEIAAVPRRPLEIVGVVDTVFGGLDFTCAPREPCAALRTPHLVTPFNLVDSHGAFGTRFGVLSNFARGCQKVWFAFFPQMFRLMTLVTTF
jgi:hypothetical protein